MPSKLGEILTLNFKNSIDDARSWGMLTIPVDVKSSGQKFSRAPTSLVRVDDLPIQTIGIVVAGSRRVAR
jgi:hypothetical protein